MLRSGGDRECSSSSSTLHISHSTSHFDLGPEGDNHMLSTQDDVTSSDSMKETTASSVTPDEHGDDTNPVQMPIHPYINKRNDVKVRCWHSGSVYSVSWEIREGTVRACMAKLCHNALELSVLRASDSDGCSAFVSLLLAIPLTLDPRSLLLLDPCLTDIQSIRENMPNGTGLSCDWVKWLVVRVVRGLAYLHSKHVAHSNLRLHHILLTYAGDVKLCGLGSSVSTSEQRKYPCPVLDTCTMEDSVYWSPEMFGSEGGEYNPECSDVYSIGLVMQELLTDNLPWLSTTDSNAAIQQRMHLNINQQQLNYNVPTEMKDTMSRVLLPHSSLRPTTHFLLYSESITHTRLNAPPTSFLPIKR